MRPSGHIVISAILSSAFLYATKSLPAAIISFFSGILIDLDHFADYFIFRGKINLNIKDFYRAITKLELKKYYLILHSLELILILWLIVLTAKYNILLVAFIFGFTQHIILDLVFNSSAMLHPRLFYFLSYRLCKKFEKEGLFIDNAE